MKFLRGLLTGLLSFLLFLCLGVFGIAYALDKTLLDPDFVVMEINKLDVASLTQELVGAQLADELVGQLPAEYRSTAGAAVEGIVYQVVAEIEPALEEEVDKAIYDAYDYLLGRSEHLRIEISLAAFREPLQSALEETFQETLQQGLPPETAALSPEELQQYMDTFYGEMTAQIPEELVISESDLPPDALALLVQARDYLGYFRTAYTALLGLMALLVVLIVLVSGNLRGSTRNLGSTLLMYGIIGLASIYLASNYLPDMSFLGMPVSLEPWLEELTRDVLAPEWTFSIGVAVAGALLLIISFIVKPKKAEI